MSIPIVVIGYNNLYWIRNFIGQIQEKFSQIIVIDNNSTDPDLLEYYKSEYPHELWRMDQNYGHQVYRTVWNRLPSKFILSDPDLELNPALPPEFVDKLSNWSDQYKLFKIGFALDISEPEGMFQNPYIDGKTIPEWEAQFWKHSVPSAEVPMYFAAIDTTFCLINKNHTPGDFGFNGTNMIRVGGNYTCKHLPWYPQILKQIELSQSGLFGNSSTGTITQMLENSRSVRKNGQDLQIPISLHNLNWWISEYPNWNPELFAQIPQLDSSKIFVDLDPQQGQLAVFCMNVFPIVVCLDSDPTNTFDLKLLNSCSSKKNLRIKTEDEILTMNPNQVGGVRIGSQTSSRLIKWAASIPQVIDPRAPTPQAAVPQESKPVKQILIVIIASSGAHYDRLTQIWRKYMFSHPEIDAVFARCSESIQEPVHTEDTFWCPGPDGLGLPIYWKTLKAIEACTQKCSYRYIYRTNLSSFIVLSKLFELSQTLPRQGIYAGVEVFCPGTETRFVSGCGFLLSFDVYQLLRDHSELIQGACAIAKDHDDLLIGRMLTHLGIVRRDLPRLDLTNLETWETQTPQTLENFFHFRIKMETDREVSDLKVQQALFARFYGTI